MTINQDMKGKEMKKPTIEEVKFFVKEKGYDVDPVSFWSYYGSVGWMVGKKPMKNWKMALAGWSHRNGKRNPSPTQAKAETIKAMHTQWESTVGSIVRDMNNPQEFELMFKDSLLKSNGFRAWAERIRPEVIA